MDTIKLTIDNREVEVPRGTTILNAIRKKQDVHKMAEANRAFAHFRF